MEIERIVRIMLLNRNFILCSTTLCTLIIISIYWAIVFIRRIINCRKYKRGAARCITDEESGYLNNQFCYHYETEIWKYVYLLVITILENLIGITMYLSYIFPSHLASIIIRNGTFFVGDCFSINGTVGDDENIVIMCKSLKFIHGIGRSAELFMFLTIVCLMNYLIIRMKEIDSFNSNSNSRFLLWITTLISSIILISNLITTSHILSLITFSVAIVVYFCIFVKTARNFKRALFQRAIERLAQHGSNQQEMKQYKYFKCTISFIGCAFLLVIIGEIILYIPATSIGILTNQNSYLPFNFFPQINFPPQITFTLLPWILRVVITIGRIINFIGISLELIPYILVTLRIWILQVYRLIRGTPKFKYSTESCSLVKPLMYA